MLEINQKSIYQEAPKYAQNMDNIPQQNQSIPMHIHPGIYPLPPILGIHNVQYMGFNNQYQRPYPPTSQEAPILLPQPVNWKPVISSRPVGCSNLTSSPFNYQKLDEKGNRNISGISDV